MAIDTRCLDYRPANVYKREIRLLEISTGRDINDPISARLVGVRVTPDLEFVGLCALLRENPSDASTEDVWVNGCRIPVPATIGQALRAVRALFRRDQGSLYQTQSNSSSSTTLTSSRRGAPKPPPSPTPPPPTSTPAHQQRAAANAAAANANATVTTTTTSTSNSNSNGGKKTPRWLRQLLRGFRSILPDESSSSRNGGHGGGSNAPLRVFVDCLCMDLRNEREAEQRRAVLQLAYGSAQITVGWLGEKDETSDVAIHILRALDEVYPPGFGTPEDRLEHPENYSPVMKWLEPIGAAWAEDGRVNGDPEKGPLYVAATKYLSRPFFQRGWIIEELTLSKFPAFLLGDEIVSWMQMLQWNRLNEEFEKAGSEYISKETEETIRKIAKMDIGIVHTLLDDFDHRRDKSDTRGLVLTLSSSTSNSRPPTATSAKGGDKLRSHLTRSF